LPLPHVEDILAALENFHFVFTATSAHSIPPVLVADAQVGNIENLILTEPKFNSKLRDKPFVQKIAALKQSRIFLAPVWDGTAT